MIKFYYHKSLNLITTDSSQTGLDVTTDLQSAFGSTCRQEHKGLMEEMGMAKGGVAGAGVVTVEGGKAVGAMAVGAMA